MDEKECATYFHKTGKVPGVNLISWVPVYNILVNTGFKQLLEGNSDDGKSN